MNAYIGNYYQVDVGYIKKGANETAPSCIQLPALDARAEPGNEMNEAEEMAAEAERAISCTPECRNDKAYWLARHSTSATTLQARRSTRTHANLKNAPNVAGTRSDVKQGDAIEFDNYATIVFSFNTMPNLADTTHGVHVAVGSNRIRGNVLEGIAKLRPRTSWRKNLTTASQ